MMLIAPLRPAGQLGGAGVVSLPCKGTNGLSVEHAPGAKERATSGDGTGAWQRKTPRTKSRAADELGPCPWEQSGAVPPNGSQQRLWGAASVVETSTSSPAS